MIPVISIVGRHDSGKTTLLVSLLGVLQARGLKIAVIKHSHHVLTFGDDTDTDLLFGAGAQAVYTVSPDVTLRYRRQAEQPPDSYLEELKDSGVDIIITEGYKHERFFKIEVLRRDIATESMGLPGTIAHVSDFLMESPRPVFDFTATEALCDHILKHVLP
ncbi:MAG: molybdopterin-guanine dinucleotide biosynthesis protein B [Syntrophomonadaceae bacterium]|nr:molybdopterin-guanine dinucleotide biosynthesis protein B [Syntrophomonadaceae bacterium]